MLLCQIHSLLIEVKFYFFETMDSWIIRRLYILIFWAIIVSCKFISPFEFLAIICGLFSITFSLLVLNNSREAVMK